MLARLYLLHTVGGDVHLARWLYDAIKTKEEEDGGLLPCNVYE